MVGVALRPANGAAQAGGEIGVAACERKGRQVAQQVLRDDDVVQRLRVAAIDVGVALVPSEAVDEVDEVRIDEVGAGQLDLLGRRGGAADRPHDVGVAVADLEGVEVADDGDVLVRVGRLPLLDESRQVLRLRAALGPHRRAVGGLLDVDQRLQVVDDDRDRE